MAGAETILLEWMGDQPMPADLLERVRDRVGAAFGCATLVRAAEDPPADSLDPRRGQHSSSRLLRWMLGRRSPGTEKRLGITDRDLCIPVLTFVFGEAQVGGTAAVVSTARLGRTYDDRPASPALAEARLIKECLHELGHTFGLVHCANPSCVMSRSNSVLDVDRKRTAFCRDCGLRLEELRDKRGA